MPLSHIQHVFACRSSSLTSQFKAAWAAPDMVGTPAWSLPDTATSPPLFLCLHSFLPLSAAPIIQSPIAATRLINMHMVTVVLGREGKACCHAVLKIRSRLGSNGSLVIHTWHIHLRYPTVVDVEGTGDRGSLYIARQGFELRGGAWVIFRALPGCELQGTEYELLRPSSWRVKRLTGFRK